MKKRSPLAVFLLSIITLGIYDIYWLVSTKKVLNQRTSHKIPSIWLLFSPILVLIIGVILMARGISTIYNTTYQSSQSVHTGTYAIGLLIMVVGAIASAVISIIWFFKYSKAVNEYTSGKMSTAVSFLVLYLIHLIGVALIQDAYNDVEAAHAGAAPLNPSTPPMNPTTAPQAPMAPPTEPTQQPMASQPVETIQPVATPPSEPPSNPMAPPPTSGQL